MEYIEPYIKRNSDGTLTLMLGEVVFPPDVTMDQLDDIKDTVTDLVSAMVEEDIVEALDALDDED